MLQSKHNRFVFFTLKQLFLQGVHLGAQLSKSHTNMKRYLLPKTGDISFSIINLHYTLVYFRLSFNLIQNVIAKKGVLLVVNESKLLMSTLKTSWKNLNQPISFGEWSSGTLTNFRFILKKTLKTFFVKSRLAQKIKKLTQLNGKLSLKLNNKIRSKFNLNIFLSELRRRIRKLYTLPHVIFVTDTMLSSVVVREANIVKIPLIGVVDSTSNVLDVTYPIPGNSSSLKTLLFYYKLLKLIILKGMLQEKVTFLKALSKKLNFELKTHQLIKTSKTKKSVPFKKVSLTVLDTFFLKKDFTDFFTNAKLFYLFYPNFKSKNFYKNLPLFHSFIKWHVYSVSNQLIKLNKSFLLKFLKVFLLNQRFFINSLFIKKFLSQNKTNILQKNKLSNFLLNFINKSSLFTESFRNVSVFNKLPDFILFKDVYSSYHCFKLNKISPLCHYKLLNFGIKQDNFIKSFNKKLNFLNFFKCNKMLFNSNTIRFPADFSYSFFHNMLNYTSFSSLFCKNSISLNNLTFRNRDFLFFYTFDLLTKYHYQDVFFSYHKMLNLYTKKRLHIILNDISSVTTYLLVYKNLHNYSFTLNNIVLKNQLIQSSKDAIKIKNYFRSNSVFSKNKLIYWNIFIENLLRNYKLFYSLKLGSLFNLNTFKIKESLLKNFNYSDKSVYEYRFKSFLQKYQAAICNIKPINLLSKGRYPKFFNKKSIEFYQYNHADKFTLNSVIQESLKGSENFNNSAVTSLTSNLKLSTAELSYTLKSFLKESKKNTSIFYNLYGKII